jgi:hypothetical protein
VKGESPSIWRLRYGRRPKAWTIMTGLVVLA